MAGDARQRLFCALRLPAETRERVAGWAAANLSGGRLVAAEQLHVTLAFLGSRPAADVAVAARALREAAAGLDGPIELEPVRYRTARSVGMIVLGDASGRATRLADALGERLEAAGIYRREARPFLAHVTVLRFRDRPRRTPVEPLPGGTFVPSDAAVFMSLLRSGGAQYEVLETVALPT